VLVEDVEVLCTEEDEDVDEDVSVLTTVVVCVLLPVEDAETVKVWVTTIVVTNVGFITPEQISYWPSKVQMELLTSNSSTYVIWYATAASELVVIASRVRSITRADRYTQEDRISIALRVGLEVETVSCEQSSLDKQLESR
jgi:hypothetical protein